jgi:alkaline phosphatase
MITTSLVASAWAKGGQGNRGKKIRNVIVMIPDGCDETVQTVARWYKGEDLQVDKMKNGVVKQHMANSVITGSAAAATAFACGEKTTVRFLGVGPREEDLLSIYDPEDMAPAYAPIASVLEGAKAVGKATGLVATSRISHATPAAFGCHIHDRGMDNEITEHLVYNNIDVAFGGGKRHLLPHPDCENGVSGGKRTDCENLLDVLYDRGYQFVETRDDMLDLSYGKAWGLFNMSHMQPDMDRQYFAPTEPSLAEMTDKAIELLSQDRDGFFLMVEGSQVDWAGHNNDPIYMIKDFIAFDDAVKVAVDFAEQDGHTVVLAYPDHNTGGMKIGHYNTAMAYTETTVEDLVDPFMGMTMTANGVVSMMPDFTPLSISDAVETYWNITLSPEDIDEIIDYAADVGESYSLARIVSENHTVVAWTTHGHNGETVPVWIHGMDAPVGTIDNTDLAFMAAEAMGVNLDWVTDSLYVDVDEVTTEYVIDTTDPENPVLDVNGALLPISKDYMTYDGHTYPLPGLTVHAPMIDKVYISHVAWWYLWRLGRV